MSAGSAGSLDSPSSQLATTPLPGSLPPPPPPPPPPHAGAHKISWVTDLELMHHYDTVTSQTIPRADEVDFVWQTVVVQMSFHNEALLHQILAVSAFHMAYLHPDRRKKLTLVGSQHQGDAAQMLRTNLANVSGKDSTALFAAASLTVIGAFAAFATRKGVGRDSADEGEGSGSGPSTGTPTTIGTPTIGTPTIGTPTAGTPTAPGADDSDDDRSSPTLEDLIDIFMLSRGMNAVLMIFEPAIQTGPMLGIFRPETAPAVPSGFLESVQAQLSLLGQQVAAVAKGEHGALPGDREVAVVVEGVIQNFLMTIRRAGETASSPIVRVSFLWPIWMEDEFITLLRARQPMALAVFTYYCAILHHSAQTAWFMRGCGRAVCRDIEKDIPAEWKEKIWWPLHYIATLEVE